MDFIIVEGVRGLHINMHDRGERKRLQPISKKTRGRKEGDVCMTINYQSRL